MEETLSVSLSGFSLGYGKSSWAWVISDKKYRVGTAKVKSEIVAELVAFGEFLNSIPDRKNVVVRTRYKEVAGSVLNAHGETKNPVVRKIRDQILSRTGTVKAVLVTDEKANRNDVIAEKLSAKVKEKSAAAKKPASPRKSTSTRRKANVPTGIITTEFDDDVEIMKSTPRGEAPVTCPSCDMPIHPLTRECGCSF